jgi:acetyl esterase
MLYPVTDGSLSQKSHEEFADGLWLSSATLSWMWDAYAPNKADRKKPEAAPLQASLDQLKGLPPALLIVDENDILRDEGEEYARKLMQAGVEVTTLRMIGTVHDFCLLNPLAETPATRATIELAADKLAEALSIETRKEAAA